MGLDFIRKAAKSFHKGLDQSRIDLGTPDLFTRTPDSAPRVYAATIRPNVRIAPGEDLSVCYRNGTIVAQKGMRTVAEFDAPPEELIKALDDSYGEACGTVQEVYEIADMMEVTVC